MQFGFMKGKGTTDAIFVARQMQENFRVKGKKLYFGFVDLEKAFDRVPREVISWTMRKLGVEEWLVSAVMSMYSGAKIVIRTVYGNSKSLEVKVGMHQGSALSTLLFVIVMEAISREFSVALPWELLYADDLAVIAETEEELIKRPTTNVWTRLDSTTYGPSPRCGVARVRGTSPRRSIARYISTTTWRRAVYRHDDVSFMFCKFTSV